MREIGSREIKQHAGAMRLVHEAGRYGKTSEPRESQGRNKTRLGVITNFILQKAGVK